MNTLNIEGGCKTGADTKSSPMGFINFHLSETEHLRLEQAEMQLQTAGTPQLMVAADMRTLHLETPQECGPLADCQYRVYLSADHQRGQFHLVGHRASDGGLVYTNAVMVDQLGYPRSNRHGAKTSRCVPGRYLKRGGCERCYAAKAVGG
jgi:hypothetical protein